MNNEKRPVEDLFDSLARHDEIETGEGAHVEAPDDSTVKELKQELDTLAIQLREPVPIVPFEDESDCRRATELVEALGQTPSASDLGAEAHDQQDLGELGQYQLLTKLGEGGMGTVYKALHTKLQKVVALKVLPSERLEDAHAVERFEREMRAVGNLDHANIVRATDAGEVDGMHYLVMELVDGIDLSSLGHRVGPVKVADACEMIRQAAVGLRHAHRRNMVHRDIKPSNLMLASNEEGQPTIKILDMGLALLDEGHVAAHRDLTSTGQMMGTLDYMAPEQGTDSHEVDIRADIYSLGATLFKLLARETPFPTKRYNTPLKLMMAKASDPAPSISSQRDDLPAELVAVIDRMLATEPDARFATPKEVAEALAPFAADADLGLLLESAMGASTADPSGVATQDFVKSGSHSTTPGIPPKRDVTERYAATIDASTTPVAEMKQAANADTQARPWYRRSIGLVSLAGVALFVIAAAIVFRIQTDYGWLVVEIADEQITATMREEGLTIEDTTSGRRYTIQAPRLPDEKRGPDWSSQQRLPTGSYKLTSETLRMRVLDDNGAEVQATEFKITRNGKLRARVSFMAETMAVSKPELRREPWRLGPGENVIAGLIPRPATLPGIKRWQLESKLIRTGIQCLDHSPDGQLLACATADGRVRIYDTINAKLVNMLSAPLGIIYGIDWSPDGESLAVEAYDKRVWIWSRAGKLQRTIPEEPPVSRPDIVDVAYSPDGQRIAISRGNVIEIWDADGRESIALKGHTGVVQSVSWSPSGERLVSCGENENAIRIWSSQGDLVQTLSDGSDSVTSVSCSPTSDQFLSAHAVGRACIWSADGTLKAAVKLDGANVTDVAWHPNGERFVAVSGGGRVTIFDAEGTLIQELRRVSAYPYNTVSWNPATDEICVGGGSNVIRRWTEAGAVLPPIAGRRLNVASLGWNGSGDRFAAGCGDGTVRVWNTDGKQVVALQQAADLRTVTSLAWHPTNSHQIATFGDDGFVRNWDLRSQTPVFRENLETSLQGLCWHPTGRFLAHAMPGSTLAIRDMEGSKEILERKHPAEVRRAAWSPDGALLASGDRQGTLLVDAPESTNPTQYEPTHRRIYALQWSPDGEYLAASDNLQITIFRRDGSVRSTITNQLSSLAFTALSWNAGGTQIAGCSFDGTIQLFSIDGELVHALRGHHSVMRDVKLHPKDVRLISSDDSGTIIHWDAVSGVPEWVDIILADQQSVRFTAAGEVLDGNPELIEREFVYVIEEYDSSRKLLTPSEFNRRIDRARASENYALAFDGKASGVYIKNGPEIDETRPFTIEAIVLATANPARVPEEPFFVEYGTNGMCLKWHAEGRPGFYVYGRREEEDEVGPHARSAAQNVDWLNRRLHIAGVFDGEAISLFVNGERHRPPLPFKPSGPEANLRNLTIGGFAGRVFEGMIDEVRVSNVARYTEDFTPAARFEPDEHTLALYHFDEGQGDTLIDSSGNDHHGKIVGSKWVKESEFVPAAPHENYALKLHGHRSWLNAHELPLTDEGPLTIDLRLRVDSIDGHAEILSLLSDDRRRIELKAHGSGFLQFIVDRTPANQASASQFKTAPKTKPVDLPGGWFELAAVIDAEEVRIYLDGKLQERQPLVTAAQRRPLQWLRLGATSADQYFDGMIDELRISSSVRYVDDFDPVERFESDQHTVALYHFDEGQGAVARDASHHAHHADLANVSWMEQVGEGQWKWIESDRQVAEWVLSVGGDVDVLAANRQIATERQQPLPSGPFRLIAIKLHHNNNITDADLHRLAGVHDLVSLYLLGASTSDGAINHLVELPRLAVLSLASTAVTDASMPTVAQLTTLHKLFLSNTSITDRGLQQLAAGELDQLHVLDIGATKVTDRGIPHLLQFGAIQELSLSQLNLTDASVETLKQLKGLTFLEIRENKLTLNGIAAMQIALPDCQIQSDFTDEEIAAAMEKLGGGSFALEFDGDTSYVEVPTLIADDSHPLTIEAVVFHDASEWAGRKTTVYDAANQHLADDVLFDLRVRQGTAALLIGRLHNWEVSDARVSGWRRTADTTAPETGWTHLACVCEKDERRLFVNGKLTTEPRIHMGTVASSYEPTQYKTAIGATVIDPTATTKQPVYRFFRGRIAEIRVSTVSRYEEDFKPSQPWDRFEPDEHTLALYHFDEGQGDTLIDSSGNNHHGKIVGAKWVKLNEKRMYPMDDPDRELAKWAIEKGAIVQVRLASGEMKSISRGDALPDGYVGTMVVNFPKNVRITNADLAHFTKGASLSALYINDGGAITNEGVKHLNALPNLNSIGIHNAQNIDTAALTQLARFSKLESITLLAAPKFEDDFVRALLPLRELHSLRLDEVPITDASLPIIGRLIRLKVLSLTRTRLTGKALEHLGQLPLLRELCLLDLNLTDDGSDFLSELRELRVLTLNATNIGDETLQRIADLKQLQDIRIQGTVVTNAGLMYLRELPNVEILDVGNRQITDAGVVHVNGLGKLRVLHLTNTQISDAGLETVKALKALTLLHLKGTQVTAEGIANLSLALPNCEIESDFTDEEISEAMEQLKK